MNTWGSPWGLPLCLLRGQTGYVGDQGRQGPVVPLGLPCVACSGRPAAFLQSLTCCPLSWYPAGHRRARRPAHTLPSLLPAHTAVPPFLIAETLYNYTPTLP